MISFLIIEASLSSCTSPNPLNALIHLANSAFSLFFSILGKRPPLIPSSVKCISLLKSLIMSMHPLRILSTSLPKLQHPFYSFLSLSIAPTCPFLRFKPINNQPNPKDSNVLYLTWMKMLREHFFLSLFSFFVFSCFVLFLAKSLENFDFLELLEGGGGGGLGGEGPPFFFFFFFSLALFERARLGRYGGGITNSKLVITFRLDSAFQIYLL